MTRNRLDTTGYPQVAWDEANPFLAGLIGGMVVVLGAVIGGML